MMQDVITKKQHNENKRMTTRSVTMHNSPKPGKEITPNREKKKIVGMEVWGLIS